MIHQRLGYTFDWKLLWAEYRDGFGSIGADFWLGLEKVHLLTSSQPYRLRVEIQDRSTKLWYSAEYWSFKIGDELNDKYRLEVSGYSGDAGDGLRHINPETGDPRFGNHNGRSFSTHDQDNDLSGHNCAGFLRGGWWHNNCKRVCLTCRESSYEWQSHAVVNSRMMIKPQ